MTAVVGAAVSVLNSPSSADSSACRFPPNVASSHVFFHSTPFSFFSSSRPLPKLRNSGRRSTRRDVEAREGSSFVYLDSKELANGPQIFFGRQCASGRNARFTRASVLQEDESVLWSSIVMKNEGKLPWVLHTQQARGVKASSMRHGRCSKFSESAHTPESYNRNDGVSQHQKQASHQQSRSSPDGQSYNGLFVGKKHFKAPLLTENQQSRLHNEVTIFESVTEPRSSGFSDCNDAHQYSLPVDADRGFSNVKEQVPNWNTEILEHRHNPQKGKLFMLKLEEELSSLRNSQGPQHLTREGKEAQGTGFQMYKKGKDALTASPSDLGNSVEDATPVRAKGDSEGQHGEGNYTAFLARKGLRNDLGQEKLLLKKTAREDEAEFTSFNLFSSSPSLPLEADSHRSNPSTFIPISKNRRPIVRHSPTSVGSRSTPSQRSVTTRNGGHMKFGSQLTNGVDGALKVNRGETHRNLSVDNISAMKMEDDNAKTLVNSLKEEVRFIEEGNFVKLESQAASGITDVVESGKTEELMEPCSGGNKEIITQGSLKLKGQRSKLISGSPTPVDHTETLGFDWDSDDEDKVYLNAEKVMPKSGPCAVSLRTISNHDDSDSRNDSTNVSESFSDTQGDASAFAKSNLTVFPDCEDDMCDQFNFRALDDDKVSAVFSDAEDGVRTPSGPDQLDGRNAIIQPNASERSFGQKPPVSANWHKHEIPGLPFEFQFSYSETPQKPVLRYREQPFSPFGPSSMKRPWIGDRPNKPSKKKPWAFDSFHPPPRDMKGVKHVQDPGPYPVGQGPKAAKSREEIMGEPLTKEEIVYLVEKCQRETRQLNLGRDGLTHNMLDLIHSHWKRRRVCRIKCKGVPTVDMDNVKLHVEDKTGGKIIYQAGGVLYLFRGRNYNYRDRPHIPLMLWKPATPVYPKLIQDPPEGLTIEEAYRLRKLGLQVKPICKLGKNGVYMTLVDDVRAAFKVDELVRVDCEGLNPSDYKKIGAKLRDLVPCVLLSFDKEHILMWKGKQETTVEGTSMLQAPELEAMAGNTCNGAEHYDLNISEGDEKAFEPPPRAQDPCEVGEAGGLLASPNCLAIDREDNEGQVDVLSTSVGLATSKEQFDEENSIRSNYVVDIDALWEHAFQSGMAIELSEGDMDSDLIVRKADELVQSAPLAPKYTIRLMYKYQMKRDPDYKPSDELQIHFGRVVTQRPKKEVKRKFQLPTVGVPGMGGLPVDELAKLLVRK